MRIFGNQFKCKYLRNKTFFINFFAAFVKSISNFEHFEKKMTFIAYVFPKLGNVKNLVR